MAFLLNKKLYTRDELLLGKKNERYILMDHIFREYTKNSILPYNTLDYPDKDFFEKQCFSTKEERDIYTQDFLKQHPEQTNLVFYIKTPKFKS